MKSQMRLHKIRRADGRVVEFTGRKSYQVGKAGLYETEAGNHVFQYAPHGNRINLVVEPLPSNIADAESLMGQHCSPFEMIGMRRAIGAADALKIA